MDWIAPAISFLGAIIAGFSAVLAWSLSRRGQHGQAHEQINRRYDRIMEFRAEHPEILALGCRWNDGNFRRIYEQRQEEDRSWALYYTYVELVLGFCNAVVYAWRRRLLDKIAYQEHYRPLMRLLLTEHQPIMTTMLRSNYLSRFVRDFWVAEASSGWDWAKQHRLLHGGEGPNEPPQLTSSSGN